MLRRITFDPKTSAYVGICLVDLFPWSFEWLLYATAFLEESVKLQESLLKVLGPRSINRWRQRKVGFKIWGLGYNF